MIEEFGHERLNRRRSFLESRANAHLGRETDRQWHSLAAATLFRDAAAVALISGEINEGRSLLRKSGELFFDTGFSGGLQLLYVAGALDESDSQPKSRINKFANAFAVHDRSELQSTSADISRSFDVTSFQPSQLHRTYQALAGRHTEDEEWSSLRSTIRKRLISNASMPVGLARMTLAAYLGTFDQLTKRGPPESKSVPGGVAQVLNSLAQQRAELLMAARGDNFHWKALLRPAELIDFDLLTLLIAGVRRGQASKLIANAFAKRDPGTALPQTLAEALSAKI